MPRPLEMYIVMLPGTRLRSRQPIRSLNYTIVNIALYQIQVIRLFICDQRTHFYFSIVETIGNIS